MIWPFLFYNLEPARILFKWNAPALWPATVDATKELAIFAEKTYRMMQKHQIAFFLLLPLAALAQADSVAAPQPIPQWLLDDWAEQTQGSGIWIADNGAYKSDNEPFDAYGIQWEWGLGKKSIKGRLYCIREGKDVGTV